MIDSPNDMDPPDYVVGDFPEEALYETIYEKFPWIEDVDDALGLLSRMSGNVRAGGVDEMLKFIIAEAHKQGCEDTKRDMGEYIHYLESEVEILKDLTKNILTGKKI